MQLVLILVGAIALYRLLLWLPLVGPVVGAVPILGVLLCLGLVSVGSKRFLAARDAARREGAKLRGLETVDTPHLRGKLGAALLAKGKARAAIEPLRAARQGEPESLEWAYRLGRALLATGDPAAARTELTFVAAADDEYAYGEALMRLAEASLGAGDGAGALVVLERVERNHGPTPQSAYWRGLAHAAEGRREDARAAFAEVRKLAAEAPKFQRGEARRWALRSLVARWSRA